VLLLCTARPEAELEGDTIRVEALSESDVGRIVEELAPVTLAHDLRTFVVERADGNPFFLEEFLRTLADRGVTSQLPSDFVVPDSLLTLLAARIDLLRAAEKAALQAGAVIGRTFRAEPVHELIGERAELGVLVERSFVRLEAALFTFVHALTREVAYGSLIASRRARLHAGFAAWLEQMGEGDDADAAQLAHHYFEAVRPEDVDLAWPEGGDELARLRAQAVRWLRRAARLSAGRYEMRDAVELLERAVQLEPERQKQLQLWQEIARANALYYDGTRFVAAMEQAIALADNDAAIADLHAELAFQTMARAGMWGTPPPGDLVETWIKRALERAEPESAARAKALIARCYSGYEKLSGDAEEASRIADRLGDPVLRSLGCDVRATVEFVRGEYEEALAWCRRRLALADELDEPEAEVFACAAAVNPAVACGELDEARRCALAHDEATRPLSPHHRLHGTAFLVQLEELIGNWAAIVELQPRVEQRVEENLATPCVMNARSLFVCALAHAYLGDEKESQRLEQIGKRLAMTGYGTVLDTPRLQLALHRHDLAAVQFLLGKPAIRTTNWFYLSAMAAHLDGLAALSEHERVEEEATAALKPGTYLQPFALRALGVVRKDERLIEQAMNQFESFGLTWHAAQTRRLL
jgi:tetratricopeptide (TPR) repeat protein